MLPQPPIAVTSHPSGLRCRRTVGAAIATAALSAATLACTPDELPNHRRAHIVGGAEDPGDPAVVALTFDEPSLAGCTGTLIAPRTVLTAAHCTAGSAPDAVYFGSRIRRDPDELGTRRVAQVHAHPQFDGHLDEGVDIALLLLDEPAPVSPVPLRRQSIYEAVGERARLVGWGSTTADSKDSGIKRHVDTTVAGIVTERLFEVGSSDATTCYGDSGGPVIVGATGDEQVAGIISYTLNGTPCSVAAGATRVDYHLADFIDPWLEEHDANPPPVVSFDAPRAEERVFAGASIEVSASDDGSVDRVEIRIDNEVIAEHNEPPYVATIPDRGGRRVITASATDNAGAVGTATIAIDVVGQSDDPGTGTGNDKADEDSESGSRDDDGDGGGCSSGGRSGAGSALGLLLALFVVRRRTSHRPPRPQ